MSTGLALSGGGSKVAFHLGALEVLEEEGVRYDAVSGTSAGALAGLCAAAGRLDLLDRELANVNHFSHVYGGSVRSFGWDVVKWKIGIGPAPLGIFNLDPLRKRIRRVVEEIDSFEAVFYPLRVCLNDGTHEFQTTLDRVVVDTLASASIPILSDPVEDPHSKGKYYADGGLRDFTPIKSVVRHDVDSLYIINTEARTTTQPAPIDSVLEVAWQTIDVVTSTIFNDDMGTFLDRNYYASWAQERGVAPLPHRTSDRPIRYIDATIIEPIEPLPRGTNFSRGALRRSKLIGRRSAQKTLN